MRTRTLFGLALGPLAIGTGLALVGLYPDIDNPPLRGLGYLLMLASIPLWNAFLLRRAKLVSDDQLNDTFEAGYQLCAAHFAEGGRPGQSSGPGAVLPRPVTLDTAERHDR